jgi:hypothetical protein
MLVDTLARVQEYLEDAVDADRTRDVLAAGRGRTADVPRQVVNG